MLKVLRRRRPPSVGESHSVLRVIISDKVLIRLFAEDRLVKLGSSELLPDSAAFTLRSIGVGGEGGDWDRSAFGRKSDGCLPEFGGVLACSITCV